MRKFDRQLLEQQFQDITGCTTKQASNHTEKYIRECVNQIIANINKPTGDETVFVSFKQIDTALGAVQVSKKRTPIWSTFQSMPIRIFAEKILGSNLSGDYTMAKINYDLLEMLATLNDPDEAVKEAYLPFKAEVDAGLLDLVPVDLVSLRAYVVDNNNRVRLEQDKKNPNQDYLDTLLENKKYASIILCLSEKFGCLNQVISESAYGRKYYKGVNLQNCPKIVRHAALGECYEYDIENSVFAWKLNFHNQLLAQYDITNPMPATLEYLDRKRAIRQRLSQDIFGSKSDKFVGIIKQAITAIGFGANDRVEGFINQQGKYQRTSLNSIIQSQAKLRQFLNDPWVAEFLQEQQTQNETIIGILRPTQDAFWKQIPDLYTSHGHIKKNSVMAYLYQQSERQVLEGILDLIDPENLLLTVHDCVYTRHPVNLLEIRGFLKDCGEYFKISEDYHNRWIDKTDELEHKARIQEEECLARGYQNGYVDNSVNLHKGKVFNSDGAAWYGNDYYNGAYYGGDAYTEQTGYDVWTDPALEELTDDEKLGYNVARKRVIANDDLPAWVKEAL